MSKNIAGLKRVGYSDTAEGAITWINGKMSSDSDWNPEATTTETTSGRLSGGSSVAPEIHFLSREDFDAIEALADNDTEKYWHLEYFDGREYVSRIPFNIQMIDPLGSNMRDGVAVAFTISAEQFHITSNVFELQDD